MKRVISTALALALLSGTSALAAPQDDHRGGDRGGGGGRPAAAAPQQAAPPHGGPGGVGHQILAQQAQGQAHAQAQAQPQAQPQAAPQRGPGWEHARDHAAGAPAAQGQARGQARGQAFQGGPGARGPGWEHAGRPNIRPQDRTARDNGRARYDARHWNFRYTPSHRFHWRGRPWISPPGFYAHTWAYGEILPWAWYTPDYYIDDWGFYGLPPAPWGCEWVREGSDAVLVDIYTGRVLSVEYGLFY